MSGLMNHIFFHEDGQVLCVAHLGELDGIRMHHDEKAGWQRQCALHHNTKQIMFTTEDQTLIMEITIQDIQRRLCDNDVPGSSMSVCLKKCLLMLLIDDLFSLTGSTESFCNLHHFCVNPYNVCLKIPEQQPFRKYYIN